ncbi:Membrane-anchored ribosome-binding protein, inhibits growth in stationary phase, ElaB/YqjD/DUF883 family [Polaromonas sp. OV174]|uniref:DUF883 family protein n=1 Tax=Polaromonas sp. OV174 TaxID=1855300 RepID=UPI0008ED7AFC|nr:DUF883 family protein [Polaromonas sp. OV174]SFB68213.1 Membrane-anchored ribosome-binding protein, inhibits growth in stationary phase, ElaB/YqjD/DUF883 family [Polaromonas sp. OV174]
MNTHSATQTARDILPAMRHASDDLLQSAGKAIDPVVDKLASTAQSLARHSLDMASDAKDHAERSLKHASRATTRYVADQPLRSVLIAAAVGAGLAWLIASSRQRRQNRY